MLCLTAQNYYIKRLLFHFGTASPAILAAFQFPQNTAQKREVFV